MAEPQTHNNTRRQEFLAFLFLTVVLAPAVTLALVGGYGFAVWMYQRVQVLDGDGGFIQQSRGDGILGPWATEYLNANADELEARSKFVPVFDVDTDDPNETSARIEPYFWDPVRVALDAQERVYVLETSRHRFQVYEKA